MFGRADGTTKLERKHLGGQAELPNEEESVWEGRQNYQIRKKVSGRADGTTKLGRKRLGGQMELPN